jgi:hypothetical protein
VRAARSASQTVSDYALIEPEGSGGTGTAAIPLARAVLCIDCDFVYAGLSGPCPAAAACPASHSKLYCTRWLAALDI